MPHRLRFYDALKVAAFQIARTVGPSGAHATSPVLKPSGAVAQIRMDLSPRLARIISRVDVVDACWPGVLHLQDRFLVSGPNKMRVLFRHHVQGARLEHLACLVELFAHAEANAAA